MKYTLLTGCGMRVSTVCLGAMTFGGQLDEQDSLAAVEYAIEHGVTFFDTANVYTGGRSEIILGKALAGRRDKVVIASKVGSSIGAGPNDCGLSRFHIMREIEKSLARLGTDHLDLYYMHVPDPDTPIDETLETMDRLVKSGKVRYIGVSNFAAWQVCQAHYESVGAGRVGPTVAQTVYNLVTRGIESELVPFLREYGLGMTVYNPLAGGLLTEKYADKKIKDNTRLSLNAKYASRYWNEENLGAWDALHAIAKEAGMTLQELAMRWLNGAGCVDSIIIGFSSLEQLKENIACAAGDPLSADIMRACESVWRGLAGTRFKYHRASPHDQS